MNGVFATGVVIALFAIATVGFNAAVWLRHRSFAAARGGWTEANFDDAMEALGVSRTSAAAVRAELSGYYMAGLTPRPDDDLQTLLMIDPDEMLELLERLFVRLDLPLPDTTVTVPTLETVGGLAVYVDRYPVSP